MIGRRCEYIDLPFPEEEPGRARVDLTRGYAQSLRAIGQALETLNLGDFSVEPDGDGYRVIGATVTRNLGVVKSGGKAVTSIEPSVRGTAMDLSYSPIDVERLEREGQAQRLNTHGTTDSSRLSQALRAIGSYLNQKYSRMLRLSRRGESFEVIYESSVGSRYSEYFTAADLYNLWVRFYLQRSARCA